MLRRAFAASLLVLALAMAASADSLLTLKSHTDAFQAMGETQPARDSEIRIWVAADRLRRDDGEASTILRLDRNKLYVVNHPDKTYSELTLPVDFVRLMPKGQEQVGALWAQQMKLAVKVTPAGETRKVNAWNARRVQMEITNATGMKIASTLWVSPEIAAWRDLNRLAATLAALQPGAADWARELEKIEGFPVLREDSVDAMGARFKTREELVSAETKDAPAGLYDPPAGYKARPFNPLEGIGG
jgi:Domain of unknown function (DUF4412)